MANRLLDGFSGWKGSNSGGTQQAQAPTTNRLSSDFEEWKKKRKPVIDANTPPVEAPMSEPEAIVSKPVDQVAWEEKSIFQKTKETIAEIPNTIGTHLRKTGEALGDTTPTSDKNWEDQSLLEKTKSTLLEAPATIVRPIASSAIKTGSAAAGVGGFLGIPGSEDMSQAIQKYSEDYQKGLAPVTYKEDDNIFDNPALLVNPEYITRVVVEQLPNLAIMMRTKGLGEGIIELGSAYNERMVKADKAGVETTPTDRIYAGSIGVINGALGKLGFDALFNKNPALRKTVSRLVGQGVERAITAVAATGAEMSTEYIQEVIPQIATKVIYDEGGTWQEVLAQAHKQGKSAASAAGIFAAPIAGFNYSGVQGSPTAERATITEQSIDGMAKTYEGETTTVDGTLNPKLVQGRVDDVAQKLTTQSTPEIADQYRASMAEKSYASYDDLQATHNEVMSGLGFEPGTAPAITIEDKNVEAKKPSEGAIGFLSALHDNDEEAINTAKDTVTKADLETALEVLTKAKEQASDDQTSFIEADIQTVQTLIQEKDGTVKEAVGKSLVEGTNELNALTPADRQDAIDTLKKVAETDHETATKAQEILAKVEETNKKVDETTKELKATKDELLAEKNAADDRAVKKSVQEKIDAVDMKRRAVEALKNTPIEDESDKIIMVEDGEFYFDEHRGEVVQAVGGNVEHLAKKDYWNAGFVRGRSVGDSHDYISYANQMRPATPEEVAQAHEKVKTGSTGLKYDELLNEKIKIKKRIAVLEKKVTKSEQFDNETKDAKELKNLRQQLNLTDEAMASVRGDAETQQEKVAKAITEKPKSIKEIAEETKILEPNVRRILGVGAKEGVFERVDKGVYVLSKDGEDIAYVHTGDALETLPKLVAQGFKADMIFLDPPYDAAGNRGGNRMNKAKKTIFETITPEQFGTFLESVSDALRTEESPLIYMFSQSKTSEKQAKEYTDKVVEAGFIPLAKGDYYKMTKDGKRFTKPMRPEALDPEGILIFNKTGSFDFKGLGGVLPELQYKLVRPRGYQTEKPEELLKSLIEMTTEEGDVVLDPFAGSGVTGEQAVKSGRKTTLIEKSEKAIEEHIKPRLKKALAERKPLKALSAVDAAIKIASKKSSLPILQEFRVKNGYLEATDLEIGIRVKTDLSDGMYKAIGKDAVATNTPAEDFPVFPKIEGKPVLTINTAEFSDLLKKAVLSISANDTRLELTSVFLGKNSLASTDSFRLFMQKMEASGEELMIASPIKLQKILSALGETLEITTNGQEISIKGSTGEAFVKNISGRYPDFQRIIPAYATRLSFDKKEMTAAIKEITPYVKEAGNKWITMQFLPETEKLTITIVSAEKNVRKQVAVSAKKEVVNTQAETVENGTLVMSIIGEASEQEVAFNLEYIKDAIDTVDGDTVFLYQAEDMKRKPNFFTGEEIPEAKKEETPKPPKKTVSRGIPKEPVVATSEVDENASETQKELARIVAEKQARKEYKDTGKKFFGAKKDMAAMRRITAENLESLEENADIAGKYVTKDKVLADTTFEVDKTGDPALEFTKWKMFKAIPSKPENTPEARKFYVEEIPKYVDALKNAKTHQEILDLGYDLMSYPRTSVTDSEARKAMIGEYRIRSRFFRKGFFDTLARQNKVGREAFSTYYAPKDFSFLDPKKREVGERKEAPKHAVLENIIREGGADLGDITPEMVKVDFGHRGVEYGNYVKDEEAKVHLRRYAESMADLEQILGIDIGEFNRAHGLGIAFGSRGTGRALAHYEPAGKVINLTKTKGDGTVAHEWGHYLDNMIYRDLFPDKPLTNDSYATHVYGSGLGNKAIGEARDALIKAMQTGVGSTTVKPGLKTYEHTTWKTVDSEIANAKEKTPQEVFDSLIAVHRFSDHKQLAEYILVRMKGESIDVKNTRSNFIARSVAQGAYWERKTELFARTFEGYIKDKGLKMGITNNYLTNTPDHVLWIPAEERPHIYAAMENYLDVVKREMKFAPAPVRGKALSGVSVENTETGEIEVKGKNALVEEAKENVAIAEFINTVAKDRATRDESGRFTGSVAESVKDETKAHKYGSPLIINDKDRGVKKMKDAIAEQYNSKQITFKEFQQLSSLVDHLKVAIDDSILTFSDEGNSIVNGYYSFNDRLARIFKNASEEQGGIPRTVTHEIWHAASRYLSDRDLNTLNREFIAQRKAFFTSGEFDKLMDELRDNESLDDTHIHLAVLNAKTPEEKIKILGTNGRAYRFTNLDEFFAESMTDITYDEFKAQTKQTDASLMSRVVLMLKRILRAFMEAVATTETNENLQNIFKSFWEGQNQQFNFRRGLQREFKGMETPIVFSEKKTTPLIKDGKIDVLELYKKVYEQIHETQAPPISSLPDEKLIRSTTKQAFTLGKRYGKKVTKDNFIAVNREIRDYIVKNIPTNDRGELLRAVINAKNKADTEKLIAKVDEMVEKGRGKEISQDKKTLMTTVYTTLQKRGMVRGRTNEVDSGMLVQLVQEISRDNRTKMKNLTVPELQQLLELAKTLKQDNKGKIRLLSKSKVDRLNDLLPENLIGKSVITMGDLEESMDNKDITGGWLGKMDKNLFRAGRLVTMKNEITKKMYDKFALAERNFADQMEAFNLDIKEKYRKATGQKTAFRNSKIDKMVIGYLEGTTPASELNADQKALAEDIVNFYAESIEVMKPNRLRKYYFTHTRQGFIEKVQEGGFQNAIKTFFTEEFVTDMMKDLPDEIAANLEFIVANNVFNPFGQPRKGGAYSKDLRKGLQTYARVYFQKKNFDKLFNQSNAVMTVLPPNMAKYFRRYVQSAKGRPEGIPYNPLLKSVIEKAITWEYIKLLGLNLASGLFNVVVGTVDNVATQGLFGKEGLIKGNARYMTPTGFKMIHKYRVASQDVTYEMTQLMHTVPEVANRIMFFHLAGGEHWLRGTVFLSLLTDQEWESQTLSDARWSEIRHKLGESQPLFGKFDSPVYVRHALGKTMLMFLTWLPTRVENWINWGTGAYTTLKEGDGLMEKTVENKDLIKLIRWGATFYVFSLLFGDRERWRQQKESYKDLFSIDYWINLANPTTKPIYKDLINFWAMMKYMYTQEEYKRAGSDYERGDLKWQVYAKRVVMPTFVKRGIEDVGKGWESTEPEE